MKRIFFGSGPQFLTDISLLGLRISAGLMMAFLHGAKKLPPADRFVDGVAALGFPAPLFFAWCAALAEFGGGIFLALGLLTRPSAFFVAFTMAVAAFGRHLNDPIAEKELSLLYLAVALFFFFHGAGRWSLDRFLFGGKKR